MTHALIDDASHRPCQYCRGIPRGDESYWAKDGLHYGGSCKRAQRAKHLGIQCRLSRPLELDQLKRVARYKSCDCFAGWGQLSDSRLGVQGREGHTAYAFQSRVYYCGFVKVCFTAAEVSRSKRRGASVRLRRVDSC